MLYANSVFLTNCQSCHGPDGSGLVGPNLTDDFYRNVNKITDIAEVIKNGAAGGSMPAWKTRLHPNEVILMAAYVAGLRDKHLSGKPIEPDKDKRLPGSSWRENADQSPPPTPGEKRDEGKKT
jgi:cytochrome c oxidase cbb3-type subunit 3